jgi:hypothetical protein
VCINRLGVDHGLIQDRSIAHGLVLYASVSTALIRIVGVGHCQRNNRRICRVITARAKHKSA